MIFPLWEGHVKDPTDVLHVGLGRPKLHWKSEVRTFHRLWPDINIVGVEANPILVALARELDYPGEVYFALAWDFNGKSALNMTMDGRSSVYEVSHMEPVQITVPAVRIDEAFGDLLGERIFLHIDVEGSEGPALRGCEGLIKAGRMPWIWTELNIAGGRPGQSLDTDVQKQLSEYGMHRVCSNKTKDTNANYDELWAL